MLLKELEDRRQLEQRADTLRAGLVAAAVYNVHLKKGKPAVKPTDFLPREVKIVTPAEMAARIRSCATAAQKKVHRA